jgi:hypothetical protein
MVHGIIFTIHMTHGIGTMVGAMVGPGDLGTVGMAAFGDGIVLMLGHIGGGGLPGVVLFMV